MLFIAIDSELLIKFVFYNHLQIVILAQFKIFFFINNIQDLQKANISNSLKNFEIKKKKEEIISWSVEK